MEQEATIKSTAETLHRLEVVLLKLISAAQVLSSDSVVSDSGLDAAQVRTGIEWLKAKELITVAESSAQEFALVTETGQRIAEQGGFELKLLAQISHSGPLALDAVFEAAREIEASLEQDEIQICLGALRAAKAISFQPDKSIVAIPGAIPKELEERDRLAREVYSKGRVPIAELQSAEQALIKQNLKKRGKGSGLFKVEVERSLTYSITSFGKEIADKMIELGITGEEIQQLTPQLLASGAWKESGFRPFNIQLPPSRIVVGKFHPYRKYVDYLRQQMVGLGFQEMVGSVVEDEFWDMDALYMPQFHSAREIHDVYFLKDPKFAKSVEEPFLSNVARAHKAGVAGGVRGWGYEYDLEKCRRLILRSQTTALSARTMASNPDIPGKYFAIARCFRYDHVDASHAPDFFQVEGIVIDPDANLRSLLGLLKIFAQEIAKSKEVKFLPAYFPFTEPSVEVHMKHPTLGWMELGGAGIFRPEVCEPLGITDPVLAWGLGTDRMAMVALGVNDIRDLTSSNLDFIRTSRVPLDL